MGSFEKMTDEKLVKKAQEGDVEAQEYIIRKYKGLVRGKARLYFIAGADGDDLVQEGMIGIFKAIKFYDASKCASFRTFVEICVNSQILNAIEKAGRQKHLPLNNSISLSIGEDSEIDLDLSNSIILATDEAHPEKSLMTKELIDELLEDRQGVFSKLERAVLAEFLEGSNYIEIAKTLGKSSKTVDNALQRIKRKAGVYFEAPN